ncbi:hypothetical protein CsSME_00043116 [Camellia sinensis var. sinensis]
MCFVHLYRFGMKYENSIKKGTKADPPCENVKNPSQPDHRTCSLPPLEWPTWALERPT